MKRLKDEKWIESTVFTRAWRWRKLFSATAFVTFLALWLTGSLGFVISLILGVISVLTLIAAAYAFDIMDRVFFIRNDLICPCGNTFNALEDKKCPSCSRVVPLEFLEE